MVQIIGVRNCTSSQNSKVLHDQKSMLGAEHANPTGIMLWGLASDNGRPSQRKSVHL
jgi:hypothetical protein